MIAYAITLHFVWALALLSTNKTIIPTPLGDIHHLMPQKAIAVLLLVAMSLAVVGLFVRQAVPALLALLPQQCLLLLSAESSAKAIFAGHYADGVPRPHGFILVDQLPAILAVIGHTWAIYVLHRSRLRRASL